MSGGDLIKLIEMVSFAEDYKMSKFDSRISEIEDKQSPLILWAEKTRELFDEIKLFEPAFDLYRWFGYFLPSRLGIAYNRDVVVVAGPIVELYNKIKEYYPLLNHVSATDAKTVDSLIEYINMLDKNRHEFLFRNIIAELSTSSVCLQATNIEASAA